MIAVTDRAKEYIRSLSRGADEIVWVVRVFWDFGDSDNKRSPSGEVIWERSGPRGWKVEAGGYRANDITEEWNLLDASGIYVDVIRVGPTFPGGLIDYANGRLFLSESAA
jgi:hypothetical protein